MPIVLEIGLLIHLSAITVTRPHCPSVTHQFRHFATASGCAVLYIVPLL